MEQQGNTEQYQPEILEKVSENELKTPLKLYSESASMEVYVKIIFAILFILTVGHNVFLAGKSFAYDTYETIKTVELSIVGIMVLAVFIMAGIAINRNLRVTKNLKEIAKKHNITLEKMQEEFSMLAVTLYGGRGVSLNK